MEVDLREATTLVNSTFEDMGSAHNDLVKGLEKDAKATNDRMDRIREDTNNNRRALRSAQKKVQAMENRMGDLEDLVRRQGEALNAMESRLCKCGGSRWAESLEDLQRTPASVSSSLSYATLSVVPAVLPEVEVVPESPEPLPVREPVGTTEEEVRPSSRVL